MTRKGSGKCAAPRVTVSVQIHLRQSVMKQMRLHRWWHAESSPVWLRLTAAQHAEIVREMLQWLQRNAALFSTTTQCG